MSKTKYSKTNDDNLRVSEGFRDPGEALQDLEIWLCAPTPYRRCTLSVRGELSPADAGPAAPSPAIGGAVVPTEDTNLRKTGKPLEDGEASND